MSTVKVRIRTIFHSLTTDRKFEDLEFEEKNIIDMMTWRQWIKNALRRTHGIFGEGIEYEILSQESTRAYVQVSSHDKDTFSSALSTYISDNELVGSPVFVLIEKESSDPMAMSIDDDDQVWLKRTLDRNSEESQCA